MWTLPVVNVDSTGSRCAIYRRWRCDEDERKRKRKTKNLGGATSGRWGTYLKLSS
jgi:hypothetical protein